jgi:hypothetical protein
MDDSTGEPWSEQELIDLGQLCSVGLPIEHVAKFLERNLDEVREQSQSIKSPRPLSRRPGSFFRYTAD